jgi:hypothetical protein
MTIKKSWSSPRACVVRQFSGAFHWSAACLPQRSNTKTGLKPQHRPTWTIFASVANGASRACLLEWGGKPSTTPFSYPSETANVHSIVLCCVLLRPIAHIGGRRYKPLQTFRSRQKPLLEGFRRHWTSPHQRIRGVECKRHA